MLPTDFDRSTSNDVRVEVLNILRMLGPTIGTGARVAHYKHAPHHVRYRAEIDLLIRHHHHHHHHLFV